MGDTVSIKGLYGGLVMGSAGLGEFPWGAGHYLAATNGIKLTESILPYLIFPLCDLVSIDKILIGFVLVLFGPFA